MDEALEVTEEVITEWEISLKAGRKSAQTVKTYTDGARAFATWASEQGIAAQATRRNLDAFSVYLREVKGNTDATISSRQLAVRRLADWWGKEDPTCPSHLANYSPIRAKAPVMEPLSEAELKALIAACKPSTDLFNARDEALIRLMAETGLRASEAADLLLADVNLAQGQALVRSGKGGKARSVGFGPQTAQSIARYLRYRAKHPLATTQRLWLGTRGRTFTYDGLHRALSTRARAAGIERFHPHLLRNTFAHRWLEAGGSHTALMAQGGWTSLEMVNRYAKFHENSRAIAEAQRINLGDV